MFQELTRCAPFVARAAPSSSAVQFSGTWWSSWLRMGPTSNLWRCDHVNLNMFVVRKTGRALRGFPSVYLWGRIWMMVTPVTVSPCIMVWKIGAGPRHLGSRLGWTFKIPLQWKREEKDVHRHTCTVNIQFLISCFLCRLDSMSK